MDPLVVGAVVVLFVGYLYFRCWLDDATIRFVKRRAERHRRLVEEQDQSRMRGSSS